MGQPNPGTWVKSGSAPTNDRLTDVDLNHQPGWPDRPKCSPALPL